MIDHDTARIVDFRGLFDRGEDVVVPLTHALSVLNNEYSHEGVRTRAGFDLSITLANIKRIAKYERIGEAPRLIILNGSGQLFDSTNLASPILTIAGMTDFAMVTIFNRAYISPHDGDKGLAGEKVYVYQGSGSARPAAGLKPSGFTLDVQNSGSSGNVEAGLRLFAVAFETDSGFITPAGPTNFTPYTAPGSLKIQINGIQAGPAGTVARHLLASKIITNYNGNQLDYELFFIPGGKVENNTNNVSHTVDFFDSNLVATADYLIDELQEIPAGVHLGLFATRMVSGGENANPHYLRVSKAADPESFSSIDGIVNVNPADGGVKNSFEQNGTLFITKSQRTYFTNDNGGEPGQWVLLRKDSAVGTECHGVGLILATGTTQEDRAIVADRAGLKLFVGSYQERELSWNIENLWKQINLAAFHTVEVGVDPINKLIYCAVPLGANTSPDKVLVCDYKEGLSPEAVKWDCWVFPAVPTTLLVDTDPTTLQPVFKFGSSAGNVYKHNPASINDFGNVIIAWYQTALAELEELGGECQYGGIRIRVVGAGDLRLSLYSEDNAFTAMLQDIALRLGPGRDEFQGFHHISQRCSVKMFVDTIDHYYKINRVLLFGKPLWNEPAS